MRTLLFFLCFLEISALLMKRDNAIISWFLGLASRSVNPTLMSSKSQPLSSSSLMHSEQHSFMPSGRTRGWHSSLPHVCAYPFTTCFCPWTFVGIGRCVIGRRR